MSRWLRGWKSQKKSHSILRAKRVTFTFWVDMDKRSLKMPKMGAFWRLFEYLKLSAERCYQTEIGGKCQNWKMRHFFLVIFNYCGLQDYWVATIRSSLSSRLQPSQLAKINGLCIWVDLLLWGISARPILYSVYSSPGRMPMPPPQYGMKRWRVM